MTSVSNAETARRTLFDDVQEGYGSAVNRAQILGHRAEGLANRIFGSNDSGLISTDAPAPDYLPHAQNLQMLRNDLDRALVRLDQALDRLSELA